MPQIINTNNSAITAQRNLNGSQSSLATSLQRLSSGLRINSAKDDAAGLAISTRMNDQLRGLSQAVRNSNDAISVTQTGDGALSEMSGMLTRIRELAVQSANATNSGVDRAALNKEAQALLAELNRFAQTTQFNGQNLLDGSTASMTFQVGANAGQTITATTSNFLTNQYGDFRHVGGRSNTSGVASGVASSQFNGAVFSGAAGAISGSVAGSGGIIAQTIRVQGTIGTSDVVVAAGDSAARVAESVNVVKNTTGVTASARTEETLVFSGNSLTGSGTSNSLILGSYSTNSTFTSATINFSLSHAAGAVSGSELTNVVNAINDKSSVTGIYAKLNDAQTGVVITHDTGNRIVFAAGASGLTTSIAVSGAGVSGLFMHAGSGAGSNIAHSGYIDGRVTFDSDKSYLLSGSLGVSGGGVLASSTTTAVAASNMQVGTLAAVNTIDVGSVSGATLALSIVDFASQTVNTQRASYGALQSRFDATVANLTSSIENLSAAKSRILDADFAAETTNLSRAQILQQAGIAALAQANALPNNVLALLQ